MLNATGRVSGKKQEVWCEQMWGLVSSQHPVVPCQGFPAQGSPLSEVIASRSEVPGLPSSGSGKASLEDCLTQELDVVGLMVCR